MLYCNVNAYGKQVMEEEILRDAYRTKTLDEVINLDFDFMVTVCDHANEIHPMFLCPIPKIYAECSDSDGKDYGAFILTHKMIKAELLPMTKEKLS